MRSSFFILVIFSFCLSCDTARLFEENKDFADNQWLKDDKVEFNFQINDLGKRYNLYCNVRNNSDYPHARFFVTYSLKDSTGSVLNSDLKMHFLFDAKTGKPFGTSGIGDVYDHRIKLLENYVFKYTGKYTISLKQEMRLDTLGGIAAVGFRLEEVVNE